MNQLLVFVKYPRPGKVKTRLCPPLSPEEASELYRAMMLDSVDQYRRLRKVQTRPQIEPPQLRPEFEKLLPGLELDNQLGEDLGARMEAAFARAFAEGAPAAVAIGTDHPSLDPAIIEKAFEILNKDEAEMVLGPAEDGGYYLLGLTRNCSALFKGIAWSGPEVASVTLQKAKKEGLKTELLPVWYDVDTVEELESLKKDLKADPARAPRVHAALGL